MSELLRAENMVKYFSAKKHGGIPVRVVNDVSSAMNEGETSGTGRGIRLRQ